MSRLCTGVRTFKLLSSVGIRVLRKKNKKKQPNQWEMIPWDRWGKGRQEFFVTALTPPKPGSFRGAHSCSQTRVGRPGAGEPAGPGVVKAAAPIRGEATPPPFPRLRSQWFRAAAPARLSRLPPRCPLPSSRSPKSPRQRLQPRPTAGCLDPALRVSNLVPPCAPTPRRLLLPLVPHKRPRVWKGRGRWARGEDRTHLEQPNRGHRFFTLSPPSWEDVTTPAPPFPSSSTMTSHPGPGVPGQHWRL